MSTATAPMASNTFGTLADSAEALIDSRLDTIERFLLGHMPRADRLAIVREVEAQIHDHLAERNPDDTDRDAVLAALARLDPPEAYLTEEGGAGHRPLGRPISARTSMAPTHSGRVSLNTSPSIAGKVSMVLGIIALLLVAVDGILLWVALSQNSAANNWLVFVLMGSMFVTLLTSLLTVSFASYAQFRGACSIAGLTTGTISFVVASTGFLFVLL